MAAAPPPMTPEKAKLILKETITLFSQPENQQRLTDALAEVAQLPPEQQPMGKMAKLMPIVTELAGGKLQEYGLPNVMMGVMQIQAVGQQDPGEAEKFFQTFCGQGNTPGGPPDWVSQKIIKMHAESSAMWTINPIQDYLDMYEDMRSKNAKSDMINVPGSTEGCWIYRCHQRMENLMNADKFNSFLKKTLEGAKRGAAY